MKTQKYLAIVTLALSCTWASLAQNTAVRWSVFDMGFGVPTSPTTSVKSAVGQSFVGITQQANTRIESGFLVDSLFRESGGTTVTLGVPVAINWNIVSLPVSDPVPDDSVRHVYTNSINAYAFAFNNGYVQRFTMSNGPGYWIKSSQTYTQDITGTARDTLTIPVATNWNMIGSISTSIDTSVAHVTPSVPGLRVSNFFKYSNGYVIASTIDPGLGYWVKASSAGSFFMHTTGPADPGEVAAKNASGKKAFTTHTIEDLNKLTIQDANGGSQTLHFGADPNGEIPVSMYVMPPLPPVGAFDARFTSDEGGTMVQTYPEVRDQLARRSPEDEGGRSEVIEMPIVIQSSAYPVTVLWKINGGSYELNDGLVSRPLKDEGSLKITNGEVNRIVLKAIGSSEMPREFALHQNYPNPFNPSTTIRFELPKRSGVELSVFNIIGQKIATLVNEERDAGRYSVVWQGTSDQGLHAASGVYFYRLNSRDVSASNGKAFVETKKLILLR